VELVGRRAEGHVSRVRSRLFERRPRYISMGVGWPELVPFSFGRDTATEIAPAAAFSGWHRRCSSQRCVAGRIELPGDEVHLRLGLEQIGRDRLVAPWVH
jgi:hypothetical protein